MKFLVLFSEDSPTPAKLRVTVPHALSPMAAVSTAFARFPWLMNYRCVAVLAPSVALLVQGLAGFTDVEEMSLSGILDREQDNRFACR